MKLLVGLGNPGKEYTNTLHNAGFKGIDALAEYLGVSNWSKQFKGLVIKGQHQGVRYILLKPQTFMNLSGESVVACKEYFKVKLKDIMVLSDDLDLPFGTIRYREKGGHGGHNGLRSIIRLCGDNEFQRIKIGIGRPQRGRGQISSYVLQRLSPEVEKELDMSIIKTVEYQLNFISGQPIHIHSENNNHAEKDNTQ